MVPSVFGITRVGWMPQSYLLGGNMIIARQTAYAAEFDALVASILGDEVETDIEIPWLSDFIHEAGVADCDLVAYHVDSLKDNGFSDEALRDDGELSSVITDTDRLETARNLFKTLEESDTDSMFDPGFFEFRVEGSQGMTAAIVMGSFGMGQAGPCFIFMGGYTDGDLLAHINGQGFMTSEQLYAVDDEWILYRWRRAS